MKKEKCNIRMTSNPSKLLTITGYRFTIPQLPFLQPFVHRTIIKDNGKNGLQLSQSQWRVSDNITGYGLWTRDTAKTKNEAINNAIEFMVNKVGKQQVKHDHDKCVKQLNLNPINTKEPIMASKKKSKKVGNITTNEVAEHLGISTFTLRTILRTHFYQDGKYTNYRWSSLNDPQIKEIAQLVPGKKKSKSTKKSKSSKKVKSIKKSKRTKKTKRNQSTE